MNDANWHARKAVECNPHLPFAHAVAGYVLGFRREHDASLIEVNQATALNPNYTDWRLPMTFVMAGQHRRAVQAARTQILTDPLYPPRAALWMGVAYCIVENGQEVAWTYRSPAGKAARKIVSPRPRIPDGTALVRCEEKHEPVSDIDTLRRRRMV